MKTRSQWKSPKTIKKVDPDNESEESYYDAFGPEYGTDEDNNGLENLVGNTEDDRHEKENDPKDKGQNTLNNADKKEDNTEKINETQSHAKQEETISNTQEEETLHVNNTEKCNIAGCSTLNAIHTARSEALSNFCRGK